jgi:hypothetical protein
MSAFPGAAAEGHWGCHLHNRSSWQMAFLVFHTAAAARWQVLRCIHRIVGEVDENSHKVAVAGAVGDIHNLLVAAVAAVVEEHRIAVEVAVVVLRNLRCIRTQTSLL